ncbi:hypothetical protein AGMMS50267_03910 [Spirochaetia bacterium]|nr:hypothetical protein AGMMS50267_03910 [Spirochaetia bacterium]
MLPNTVMVKVGKDEAPGKNGGKSQTRRQNDEWKPQTSTGKPFLQKLNHVS